MANNECVLLTEEKLFPLTDTNNCLKMCKSESFKNDTTGKWMYIYLPQVCNVPVALQHYDRHVNML